jgi:Fe-S cluster assembly protein SufB
MMESAYNHHKPFFKTQKGLHRTIVEQISQQKNEPGWMTDFRLNALATFERLPLPTWGADLSALDMADIYYYLRPLEDHHSSWETVPDSIKKTFEKLGIPQAEQKFLAGVGAQFESEVIYKRLQKKWADAGVIFTDMSTALKDHPELVEKYFATIIPAHDNKFAALNSAVWSGGSFVYVPRGVQIEMPLQAYFRINAASMGQFERTLIIAESGSFVHYVEGCSAPLYRKSSLHSAVVELIAHDNAHIRYTTIQNWSNNVYNLVTKRGMAHAGATIEWIDGNFGSKATMKYPCVILKGARSKAQIISIAVAGSGQHQDAGAKVIHLGADTTSHVISKSISKKGGRASYRGLLKIGKHAHNAQSRVQCDALILDEHSRSDTYPTVVVDNRTADMGHEATVSKISDEQIFYLMSRGLNEVMARALIVNGFIDAFVKELPMEYAVEINRLIAHEMEGSIG